MKKLYVYADFDWLETPQLIGELSCDSVRGSETYGFSYDREWLAKYGDVFLSEDLQNYTGIQYTRPDHDVSHRPFGPHIAESSGANCRYR